MRDYSKFSPRFWNGATGRRLRKLGAPTQVIAVYLFTCPSANMLGLYYLALPTLCHETGSPLEGALESLRSLQRMDFAYYDLESETVFVTNMAREQIGRELKPKDNRHVAVLRELEQLRNTPFFNDFLNRYREPFQLQCVEFDKPLTRGLQGPSEPLRSQDQEQDQDQEHDQEQEHAHGGGGLPSQPAHALGGVNGKARGVNGHALVFAPSPAHAPPALGYAADFEALKHAYPRRSGSQRWADAKTLFVENLSAGVSAADMLKGAARYAAYCDAEGITGTSKVQQARTFLGPNQGWRDAWTPTPRKLTASEQWLADQAAKDAAKAAAAEANDAQH